MYKAINKLKSDKKGFTLTELLITMVIMGIALLLVTNLMILIIRNYRIVEYRWIAQTMAEYLASTLSSDSGIEALGTADACELMYDNATPDASGNFTLLSCPELGQLNFDSETEDLSITPDDAYKDLLVSKGYIYYFTLGEHLYRIHYSDIVDTDTLELKNAVIAPVAKSLNILTDNPEMGAEARIEFAMARGAGDYDTTTNAEDFDSATKYLATGLTANIWVRVTNKAEPELTSKTDMNVSVYMNNMNTGNRINYIPGGVTLSNEYVCGWTPNNAGEILDGFPTDAILDNAGATSDSVSHYANIVRYHSINTPTNLSDSTQSGSIGVSMDIPLCFFMATIGNGENSEALKPIREFRDQFLRGSKVGDWIIHEYYYDVSPTLIMWMEAMPELKPVAVFAAKGVSALAEVFVD